MLNYHWIPYHRNESERRFFARQNPRFIKVVWEGPQPPYCEDLPPGCVYIYRDYAAESERVSLGADPEAFGRQHAEAMRQANAYLRGRGMPQERILVESLNEPQVWTENESPAHIARYLVAFLDAVHGWDGHAVVGNFGVGWPANQGPDTPPDWEFFRPVAAAMMPGDYLGVHEYWWNQGCGQNWGWWAGRVLKCPYRVPILVTECGIDKGVADTSPPPEGWMGLPGNTLDERADRYISELWDYMGRMAQDSRVQGVLPFTYDAGTHSAWALFNVDDDVWKAALERKLAQETMPHPQAFAWGEQPPVPPPPGEAATGVDVSYWQKAAVRWGEIESAGGTFAYIRSSVGLSVDSALFRHLDQSTGRTLLRGIYHYLKPDYDAATQARLLAALHAWTQLELPPAVDVEDEGLVAAQVKAFVDAWNTHSHGSKLVIYTSASKWARLVGPGATWARGCLLWVAHWNTDQPVLPDIWDRYEFWQHGPLAGAGYDAAIDRDRFPGTQSELLAKYGGGLPPKPPAGPHVEYRPGAAIIVGDYPEANVAMSLVDPWGNLRTAVSGSKPEWGNGGFEFLTSAPVTHILTVQGESWPVEVRSDRTAVLSWA